MIMIMIIVIIIIIIKTYFIKLFSNWKLNTNLV